MRRLRSFWSSWDDRPRAAMSPWRVDGIKRMDFTRPGTRVQVQAEGARVGAGFTPPAPAAGAARALLRAPLAPRFMSRLLVGLLKLFPPVSIVEERGEAVLEGARGPRTGTAAPGGGGRGGGGREGPRGRVPPSGSRSPKPGQPPRRPCDLAIPRRGRAGLPVPPRWGGGRWGAVRGYGSGWAPGLWVAAGEAKWEPGPGGTRGRSWGLLSLCRTGP